MNQINLLFLNAMNPDDYNRFGFNFFKSKGFKVKVLILGLVYDENFLLFNRNFEELTAENFIIFKDIKSLQKYFMENKDDIYIDFFIGNSSWNYRSLKIYHIINKFKLRLFLPISSFTPTQSKKNLSIFKFIKNTNFKKNFFLEFLSRKIIFFLRRLGFYKNIYEIIFSIQNNETYKFKNKFLLSAKVYNYSTTIQDLRLKSKSFNFKDENLKQNSPILYLDEAIGCHPDASSSNTINIDKYYKYHLKLLENFFFKISKLLHKNIVVASHPRNELINKEYGKINSFFRKEMIFKYETANLIKSCDICLAHSSTTVQLALLNQKKILILDMNNFHQGPSVTSKKFNLPIIDISKSYTDIEIKNKLFKQKVDNKLIQSYFGISKKFTYEYIYQYINEKKNLNTN